MKRVSYIKRRAQRKNMWEQNDEKNIYDQQIHNFSLFRWFDRRGQYARL
jgi:hypothetical protein